MQSFGQHMFRGYRDLLYQNTGIYLGEHKSYLLQSKLNRLMSHHQMESPDAYLNLISRAENVRERQEFIDMMTTNTTEFFRESGHFDFLRDQIHFLLEHNPRINQDRVIRVWSAACSTGQEPITLALVLKELLADRYDIRILATDISNRVLGKALAGIYSQSDCTGLPGYYRKKYFRPFQDGYQVEDEIRSMITYRRFNLMEDFRFRWGFDLIFCRNVMIYFNHQVQQQLADKFYRSLVPGGVIFLGHSESLLNKKHRFRSIGHSIYMKP